MSPLNLGTVTQYMSVYVCLSELRCHVVYILMNCHLRTAIWIQNDTYRQGWVTQLVCKSKFVRFYLYVRWPKYCRQKPYNDVGHGGWGKVYDFDKKLEGQNSLQNNFLIGAIKKI